MEATTDGLIKYKCFSKWNNETMPSLTRELLMLNLFFHMSSRKLSIFYIIPFKLMDKLQRNVILKPEEYSSRTEYKVEYMGVYFSEFKSEEKGRGES